MIAIPIIIISIICPITLIAMIITAASKKNRDEIANTEHAIRNIYIYTILIIMLISIIVFSISGLRIGLDLIIPEKRTSNNYNYEQRDKNENIVNLITNISIIAVAVPIFLKHNKLAKDLKK